MQLNSLSGRFLVLTTIFVVLAEIFILVPSVARYRVDYLHLRLERAQIASLAVAATDTLDESLEAELLATAGVLNVVLSREEQRQLVLSNPILATMQAPVKYDLRNQSSFQIIHDAIIALLGRNEDVIRVVGNPVQDAGLLIEVTMETAPMRAAMLEYGARVLALSAIFSGLTAVLLFLAVRRLMLTPIRRLVNHMTSYAEAPEDARRIIEPTASVAELRDAEVALAAMQTQLTGALRQKERLAQLGGAVARISHDLRNMLTVAQLFADRMEKSNDPAVQRAAPKLVNSLSRAINLCESTLAFGRAEEPPPALTRFNLLPLVTEIVESERMASNDKVEFLVDVPPALALRADSEQLHRVLSNLVRNARQAIEATEQPGTIEISAGEEEQDWWIRVGDTGPGLPEKAREHLFTAFQGGARKGGFGLGLAISAELIRGHGGQLLLVRTDSEGTEFLMRLPRAANGIGVISV